MDRVTGSLARKIGNIQARGNPLLFIDVITKQELTWPQRFCQFGARLQILPLPLRYGTWKID